MKVVVLIISVLSLISVGLSFVGYVRSLEFQAYSNKAMDGINEVSLYISNASTSTLTDEKALRTSLQHAAIMTKMANEGFVRIPEAAESHRQISIIGLIVSMIIACLCIVLFILNRMLTVRP